MRAITGAQIALFSGLSTAIFAMGLGITIGILQLLPPFEYRPIIGVMLAVVNVYASAFVIYRAFLRVLPLEAGELASGSRGEFSAQVNILFYLVFFNALIRTNFLPVPLMRIIYQWLGTTMGTNSYSAGAILDPPLTSVGDNCIIGHNAVIFAHAIEGPHFALSPVRLGNNVTVGAMAIVMAGVTIDDDAIVSAGAVVRKDTHIGRGEIWGGVPARCLGHSVTRTDIS